MPVYSMTGFASAQQSADAASAQGDGAARLAIEIRSVNGRFLDLSFRLPEELRRLEPALRELLVARLRRGKVELRASTEGAAGAALPEVSPRQLQRLASLQDSVRSWLPDAVPLGVADVIRLSAADGAHTVDWAAVLPDLTTQALDSLLAAREREGARLTAMLQANLGQLRELARQARPLVPELVQQQRSRFLDRWREAMALADGAALPEAAEERALTEAAAYAMRIDVAEELTRLESHLHEIERLLAAGGEVGKRLDFLIQELHREANTLGSKAAALELTRISVEMKVLIEQMREQVQNIE
ncbi:MAG: YicC family protein [Proteobacteria bacterium]|nr:YicC family protein [Pseudomonadota bacterium]